MNKNLILNPKFLGCIAIILLAIQGFCQTPKDTTKNVRVLKLEEVVAALEKNPTLLSFDERINSIKAYSEAARAIDPPTISGGLWMTPYKMPEPEVDGMGMEMEPEDKGSLMIGVEQMIMNPAKRKAEQRYMAGMSTVEETMKSYDRQNMIEEAKKMYYEWIILKKKHSVLQDSERIMNLMIKSGEIGYTYNQNELNRIYKAKSELFNIKNMQIMIEGEIKTMNVGLNTMMNIDKNIVFDIDTNYSIKDYELQAIDTTSISQNRSDIQNINESLKLFGLRRELELSQRKPDFGIQYAHMSNFGSMPNQFNLMGMVTIPIAPWSAKKYKANLKGIEFETKSLNLKKQAIVNETVGNLEKLRASISSKKKQVQMYEQNLIPALEKNFNTSLIAFEHMKEDMFMTIDAWMALRMARIEHLDLTQELLKMQASYERQIEKK